MLLQENAMEVLKETSRTFFIPISLLPPQLKEAVASAYLCMRAIDEIEDHPNFDREHKIQLLHSISVTLNNPFSDQEINSLLEPYRTILPPVTLQLSDWIKLCPPLAAPHVLHSTCVMAEGMARWVEKEFEVHTEEDLDEYTYYVAGLVGELLSDLWKWYDNIETDKELAIAFGRGLQAVNMIRNRSEDLDRGGVDFFPNDWDMNDMFIYARRNLEKADQYIEGMEAGPVLSFCQIPLALAKGTLDAIEKGKEKLSRDDVVSIVSKVSGQ